jgi:exopolysaccharide biosynthesis protein
VPEQIAMSLVLALFMAELRPIETLEIARDLRIERYRLDGPVRITIVAVDPKKFRIKVGLPHGQTVTPERLSAMQRRTDCLIAINAGFFKFTGWDSADPLGIAKVNGQLVSEADASRAAIGFGEKHAIFGRPMVHVTAACRHARHRIAAINRDAHADEFGLTRDVVRFKMAEPTASRLVLSLKSERAQLDCPSDQVPSCWRTLHCIPEISESWVDLEGVTPWSSARYVVAAGPWILRRGNVAVYGSKTEVEPVENFSQKRHPRTAVGVRRDGSVVFAVVDGRNPDWSVGMSLEELGSFFSAIRCTDAINMDGGGSSAMATYDGLLTCPVVSGGAAERGISTAFLVFPR